MENYICTSKTLTSPARYVQSDAPDCSVSFCSGKSQFSKCSISEISFLFSSSIVYIYFYHFGDLLIYPTVLTYNSTKTLTSARLKQTFWMPPIQ